MPWYERSANRRLVGSMPRGMKVRRVAAIALLALYALWSTASSFDVPGESFTHYAHAWVFQLQGGIYVALALAATVGLVRRWWWARMLSVSLALGVLFRAGEEAVSWRIHILELIQFAWAGAVVACLRGPDFLELYEGQRPADVDWRTRGMWALWWAIVLNGVTLVNASILLIGAWQELHGCFGPLPNIDHNAPTYWPAVVLAGLLLVGLGLVARQRTAGLLLTGVVSVAFPIVLLVYLRSFGKVGQWNEGLLAPALPGLVAVWVALAFWVRPMFRLLRRGAA
jgi:hypothetical protein